jgi:lysophospholipase L1-like esterase
VQRDGPTSARYAWSGCGFKLRFFGTGLVATFSDDENLHTVLVDGEQQLPLRVGGAAQRVVLAADLPLAEHQVEVYRRTEPLFGPTQLHGLEVTGGELLPPPPRAPRHIEVVGDSISCGYGNEGVDANCSFSPATENHYASYGALTARALSASLSTVAWSGRGVVKNYDGEPGDLMPSLYERTLPHDPESSWSFEDRADAVLVNLGTNDFSTNPDPTHDDFATAYAKLLAHIRSRHASALILCITGPMLGGEDANKASAAISGAVTQRKAAGDTNVASFRHTTTNDSPGCDWHPSVATHQKLADELVTELKSRLPRSVPS